MLCGYGTTVVAVSFTLCICVIGVLVSPAKLFPGNGRSISGVDIDAIVRAAPVKARHITDKNIIPDAAIGGIEKRDTMLCKIS